jgi:hypothetical protein
LGQDQGGEIIPPAISYRFVGPGTVAPDPLPDGEIWLDVGGRLGPRVFDHHGGDTDAWCSAELVAEHYRRLLLDQIPDPGAVTIVLHQGPGLDGIISTWLVRSILATGGPPKPTHGVSSIVRAAAEHDQGFLKTEDPKGCWSLVLRLVLATDPEARDDAGEVKCGLRLVEQSFAALAEGQRLDDVARGLVTPTVHAIIAHGERDYGEDLTRALQFQVRLPVRLLEPWLRTCDSVPQDPPDPATERWSLADAIFLDDPSSTLFRELARGDRENPPGGKGFALMVVSRDPELASDPPLRRHVISTDPMSGLHLKGLGRQMEELEQKKEDELGLPLAKGRERVAHGTGRHGYNVPSPWYDGRGHAFTIVDSPLVQIEDRHICGSLLTAREVLDAVWNYGDPLSFLHVEGARVAVIRSVRVSPEWREHWPEGASLEELCPDLAHEIASAESAPSVFRRRGPQPIADLEATCVEQQLWLTDHHDGLWLALFEIDRNTDNAQQLCAITKQLRADAHRRLDTPGLEFDENRELYHLVMFRARASEVSLEEGTGPSALARHLLSEGRASSFHSLADTRQMDDSRTAFSRERDAAVSCTVRGACAISTRTHPLSEENGFLNPLQLAGLVTLFLAQKQRLRDLSARFTRHRSEGHPMRAARLILDDQWELLRLDQELSVSRVSDRALGQRTYEALAEVHHLPKLLEDTKRRIETLAQHVRDTKAAFFQRVGLWVSILFAPLAITASIFSGTHLQRHFSDNNVSFIPNGALPAGWMDFLLVFVVVSAALGVLWVLMRLAYGRESSLQRGNRSPPPD